jgi:hypothetical protein
MFSSSVLRLGEARIHRTGAATMIQIPLATQQQFLFISLHTDKNTHIEAQLLKIINATKPPVSHGKHSGFANNSTHIIHFNISQILTGSHSFFTELNVPF